MRADSLILTRENGKEFQMFYAVFRIDQTGEWRGYEEGKVNLPYIFDSMDRAIRELQRTLKDINNVGWTYSISFYDR